MRLSGSTSRSDRRKPRLARAGWRRAGAAGRLRRLLATALLAAAPAGWGAEPPDAERGRLLYENHCVVCHTAKVHRRIPPLPIDLTELRLIVTAWAKGQNLRWSDAEISDVVEYLDRTYYRMLGK